jgi:hypothetical protein
MHPLISVAGVLSCLVTLANLIEASASPTAGSSSSQAEAMQRIYNETRSVLEEKIPSYRNEHTKHVFWSPRLGLHRLFF